MIKILTWHYKISEDLFCAVFEVHGYLEIFERMQVYIKIEESQPIFLENWSLRKHKCVLSK